MIGAISPGGGGGGVEGAELVLIGWSFAVRGRSGEEVNGSVCGNCRSGNIAPILETTLPRLLSAVVVLSCDERLLTPPPPTCRSGLVFGLDPRRVKAVFNRPTGDGDRFCDISGGAFNVLVTSVGADSEAARLLVLDMWKVAARGVGEPSN